MDNQSSGIMAGVGGLFYMALLVLSIVGLWKLFEKAGKPGWASLVPIYNIIVMFEIIGKPLWQIVLFLVPIANLYVIITMVVGMAKSYGKYGIGNYLFAFFLSPIAFAMWGFSAETRYVGPSEGPGAVGGPGFASPGSATF
ncbi:DUF5684 domain-containing protein [Hymenobacter arcticus]